MEPNPSIWDFKNCLLDHWDFLMGSSIPLLLTLYYQVKNKPVPKFLCLGLALIFLISASFLAWRDQALSRISAQNDADSAKKMMVYQQKRLDRLSDDFRKTGGPKETQVSQNNGMTGDIKNNSGPISFTVYNGMSPNQTNATSGRVGPMNTTDEPAIFSGRSQEVVDYLYANKVFEGFGPSDTNRFLYLREKDDGEYIIVLKLQYEPVPAVSKAKFGRVCPTICHS